MGHVMVSGGKPDMAAPVAGILLSSIAEGSIVKLNENGSPVEFYVAKQNYESSLNGEGRTLLLRKDIHSNQFWDAGNVNAYYGSDIDVWLNETYKQTLDAEVQSVIGETCFYYTVGNGNSTVTTLNRSVFILSGAEYGEYSSHSSSINEEGSALPIASIIKTACIYGTPAIHWTRTPRPDLTYAVGYMTTAGGLYPYSHANTSYGARPAFTLPKTVKVDTETMIIKVVA